jgi:cytochrome c-type biogenesis protein CcmH/NrfF
MPNLIAKLAGEWTEAGKSDEAILAELVKRYGKNVLRLHQN